MRYLYMSVFSLNFYCIVLYCICNVCIVAKRSVRLIEHRPKIRRVTLSNLGRARD